MEQRNSIFRGSRARDVPQRGHQRAPRPRIEKGLAQIPPFNHSLPPESYPFRGSERHKGVRLGYQESLQHYPDGKEGSNEGFQ